MQFLPDLGIIDHKHVMLTNSCYVLSSTITRFERKPTHSTNGTCDCCSVDVRSIACGPHHVIAVGSDGDVYSWGRATDGCLGLGNDDNQ